MVDGVHGAAMVAAVDLVVEVLNIETDLATIHPLSTEGAIVLDHHLKELLAIRTVVQQVNKRIHEGHEVFSKIKLPCKISICRF